MLPHVWVIHPLIKAGLPHKRLLQWPKQAEYAPEAALAGDGRTHARADGEHRHGTPKHKRRGLVVGL